MISNQQIPTMAPMGRRQKAGPKSKAAPSRVLNLKQKAIQSPEELKSLATTDVSMSSNNKIQTSAYCDVAHREPIPPESEFVCSTVYALPMKLRVYSVLRIHLLFISLRRGSHVSNLGDARNRRPTLVCHQTLLTHPNLQRALTPPNFRPTEDPRFPLPR